MRGIKNKPKILGFGIAPFLAFGVILSFTLFQPVLADQKSNTWSSDKDFTNWQMSNTELVGNDGGIVLQKDSSTGSYKTSGSAIYKYSPGGLNKWTDAQTDVADSSVSPAKYDWLAIPYQNKVSQVDATTGTVVKDWAVGYYPEKVAVGSNHDVWVANANLNIIGPCQNSTDERCYSISHIDPTNNKVTTRQLPWGAGQTQNGLLRSVSYNSATHELWVGDYTNQRIVIVDTTNFDNVSTPISYQDLSVSFSPMGSSFDAGQANIYFVANAEAVYMFSATLKTLDQTLNTASVYGSTGVNVDYQGNIWLSNYLNGYKLNRVHRTGSSGSYVYTLQSFNFAYPAGCVSNCQGPAQATIIPNALDDNPGDGADTLASALNATSLVGVARVTGNDSANASLSVIDFKGPNISSVGGSVNGDGAGNLWVFPYATSIYKLTQVSSYATSETHAIGPSSLIAYNQFYGDSISSASTNFTIKYSSNNQDWKTNISSVDPSEDLYIKADFTGQNQSPILKSLKINYSTNAFNNLRPRIEKLTYKTAQDRSQQKMSDVTFEQNQKIFVRLKVFESLDSRDQVTVSDTFEGADKTEIKNSLVYREGPNCDLEISGSQRNVSVVDISGGLSFGFPYLNQGLTCIDYEYTLK